jgi:hypothetical protein
LRFTNALGEGRGVCDVSLEDISDSMESLWTMRSSSLKTIRMLGFGGIIGSKDEWDTWQLEAIHQWVAGWENEAVRFEAENGELARDYLAARGIS